MKHDTVGIPSTGGDSSEPSWRRYQRFLGPDVARDIDDEFEFHIATRADELIAHGMSVAQAMVQARREFGDATYAKQLCQLIDARDTRRPTWSMVMDSLLRDVRYAARTLRRSPLFTIVAVVTLALGIGANTAIFSLVNAVLLHPIPTPALDRLFVVREDLIPLNLLGADLSPGEALDLAARKDLFETSGAYAATNRNLTGLGDPQRLSTVSTMGDFFGTLGVRPYLGRLYRPEDSKEGAPSVVVMSYGAWHELGGGDPKFIGRVLQLNGAPSEVIGVLPPDFRYPRSAQLYTPLVLRANVLGPEQRRSLYMTFIGRTAPGVTIDRIRALLASEVVRWQERLGGYEAGSFVLRPTPFVDYVAGQLRPILLVLMGAVAIVLLITCANVGSLSLVRGASRWREIAVRAAIGASRGVIVRQLLIESLALAAVGGLLGLVVGKLLLAMLARMRLEQYQALQDVHLDSRVLLFTGAVAILAGVLFGLMPALRASRFDLNETLKESGRGNSLAAGRSRLLQSSVIVQLALTLVLLLASVLTLRSLAALLQSDPGFRPAQATALRMALPGTRYSSSAARLAFYAGVLDRVRGVPGVQATGLGSFVPFGDGGDSSPLQILGKPSVPGDPELHADISVVQGGYFRALGMTMLAGRDFLPSENAPDVLPAIVNEALVKQYFGKENPIGRQISQGRPATIVGVVSTVSRYELSEAPKPIVYYHYPQWGWLNSMYVTVRSTLSAAQVAAQVRSAVREIDKDVPVFDVAPMRQRVDNSVGARRLAMFVLSGFAALALVLAVMGIYGVLSYNVSQRSHEIGIRLALGARPQDVVRMIVRAGLLLAAVGLGVGFLIFLALARVMASLVFGVGPRDPLTIGSGLVTLIAVAALASWFPARRASRVAPSEALRSE